jgi:hypothetical protein
MNEKRTQDQRPVFMGTYSKQVKNITDQLTYVKDDIKSLTKSNSALYNQTAELNRRIGINTLLSIAAVIMSVLAAIIAAID